MQSCKKPHLPIVRTYDITEINETTAKSGGEVIDDGGADIIARGVCLYSSMYSPEPESCTMDGWGEGRFISNLSGLIPGTTYYLKAYATNSVGTSYGRQMIFTTVGIVINPPVFNPELNYGTLTDIDSNVYKTIQIGDQVWMAENLKVTKFRNGVPLNVLNSVNVSDWIRSAGYSNYTFYEHEANIYGRLYNFKAVIDNQYLCPTGWHIPDDSEWETMINYLGGDSLATYKLMETGNNHWVFPVPDLTNESGFTAVPGGYLHVYTQQMCGLPYAYEFVSKGVEAVWWTSSAVSSYSNYVYIIDSNLAQTNYSIDNRATPVIYKSTKDVCYIRCIRNY